MTKVCQQDPRDRKPTHNKFNEIENSKLFKSPPNLMTVITELKKDSLCKRGGKIIRTLDNDQLAHKEVDKKWRLSNDEQGISVYLRQEAYLSKKYYSRNSYRRTNVALYEIQNNWSSVLRDSRIINKKDNKKAYACPNLFKWQGSFHHDKSKWPMYLHFYTSLN